ncbi:MAG: AAC(3) family N-acetyltransferase [Flavobacteriales bacterium]|jgi:aminoglycoside 3-N-acetyltransferase|nr:AAC(3) family N-acetyltransferase [Flavobacteriales bacterium]
MGYPAAMGIAAGDVVMLMADTTRLAWRLRHSGGPPATVRLLDAFRAAVGPAGTLLVPTYTFDLPAGAAFDRRHTGTISGALGTAALAHPAFGRTPHPLHSFAVTGAARPALMDADEPHSFGPGSPFAFLHAHHGLLVTVDLPVNNALTFAHFVEVREGVRYRTERTMAFAYTDLDGTTRERTFAIMAKKPGHHMDFTPMETALEAAGALRRGVVDGLRWTVTDLHAAYPVIARDLRTGGASGIHRFRWSWWLRDVTKSLLRRFGVRTKPERLAHAARSSR